MPGIRRGQHAPAEVYLCVLTAHNVPPRPLTRYSRERAPSSDFCFIMALLVVRVKRRLFIVICRKAGTFREHSLIMANCYPLPPLPCHTELYAIGPQQGGFSQSGRRSKPCKLIVALLHNKHRNSDDKKKYAQASTRIFTKIKKKSTVPGKVAHTKSAVHYELLHPKM